MARIELKEFDLGPFNHLYFELINDAGNRLNQLNGLSTNPETGDTIAFTVLPGSLLRVFDNIVLEGTIDVNKDPGTIIFEGSDADITIVAAYIDRFIEFINANSEYLPYFASAIGGTFNSNSAANTFGNIISLAVDVNQTALENAKGNILVNPGVGKDILRDQTWAPILDGAVITGSKVTGTFGRDRMNNGRDDDVLIGMNGNDIFSFIPKNTFKNWLAADHPNVTFLRDEAISIGNVHFFGGTMWTDFNGGDMQANF